MLCRVALGTQMVNNPLGVSPSKGIREPHELKKNLFDLGGNRTHDLRNRSVVTLPTELRGRTEKIGDDLGGESRRRESKGTRECCAAEHYEHKWFHRELTLKCKLKC